MHTHKIKTDLYPFSIIHIHSCDVYTWNDGNSVSLPGHNADVLLHGGGDEALEHSYVAPHRALVRHPHGIGLPENCKNAQKILRLLICQAFKGKIISLLLNSLGVVTHDGLNII